MDLTLSNISINQLLIFIAVAQAKGFLKASTEMHLSQSAVSKSIAKLEAELGLELFKRTTRELKLTREGKLLYDAWKPQIISLQTAYKHVKRSLDEENQVLKIGLVSTVLPGRYFTGIRNEFRKEYPEIRLSLFSEHMSTLESMLEEGTLDAAFLPDFVHYTLDEKGLSWFWVQKRHARVILSSNHPLAAKNNIKMEEILHEKFASLRDQMTDNYERDLKERFAQYGVVTDIETQYQSAYSVRNLFHSEQELLFVDEFFDIISYEDTTSISVENELNGIICAYRPGETKNIKLFLEIVRKHAVIED